MKARILSGDGEVLGVFDLREGEYVIGSLPPARLLIESESVAATHARLKVGAYGAEVEDLGSGRGTMLDGVPVVGSPVIASGARITVGDFAVEVWNPDFEHPMSGRYRVGSVVAKGAMGVIRRAREQSTGREVAMKQMHGELETRDAALAARFVQEARITAHLEHPNIVPVHDVSPGAEGSRFYTMKMVRGISLEEVLAKIEAREAAALRSYPLENLLTIFQKVCDAVAFAHSRGVIHRDLKPANIMVGEYGEVLVMDWGLAKLGGEAGSTLAGAPGSVLDEAAAGATLAGTVMGTPHYMSPEQAGGNLEMLDERSDVYALGAILYELLTLRTPVEGEGAREVLGKVRAGKIEPPLVRVGTTVLPHLPGGRPPASLSAVAMKALALAPRSRYASVPELQAEIRAFQSGFATGAEEASALRQFTLLLQRHRGVATAIAASVLLLAALSALYTASVVREKNRAQASELRATQNEEAARLSAASARQAQATAETNAQLARESEAKAAASAQLAQEKEAAARLAEEKAKSALADMLTAQNRTARAEQERTLAESSAKTAEAEKQMAAQAATAAKAETEEARKTKASQRIAALPAETDAAALRGDAGTVLVNSIFLLDRETDPERVTLHRRRIGAALQQMPRLLYLREDAQLARISPNGATGVFFEGAKGTLFDPATGQPIGPSLKHGIKGTAEAAEFGNDSRLLLTAGTISPGQPGVWVWEAATGRELPLPRWRYEGNLESFLPYPDHSRILTVHAAPKSKLKEFNLWFMDGTTPTARLKSPTIEGLVSALVPLPRTNQFFLQSFTNAAGDRSGFLHSIVPGSSTLRCDPLRKPALEAAAAISPDASRAVQFTTRQLRLAEAPPPDPSGHSAGPQVLSFPKGASAGGVPVRTLVGEPQELLDAATGKAIGRALAGGASVFSPDSKWLLVADGERAFLHHALDNDAGLSFELALPARAATLAFSADSSRAIIVAEDGSVSLWSTKAGRRVCPDVLWPAEVKETSTSESARFLFLTGRGVSLWDTAPPDPRPPVNFNKLSTNAVWVAGDGRYAVAIPPSAIPPSTKGNATAVPA
ncbi:MAG: FHA domain-containing serine/threonine-protein kinase, partial [Chthoniobacteraceae bacterium]